MNTRGLRFIVAPYALIDVLMALQKDHRQVGDVCVSKSDGHLEVTCTVNPYGEEHPTPCCNIKEAPL